MIGNLTRALRTSYYPAVVRLVGEDFFTAAAEQFIVKNPPGAANLKKHGAGFADFLGVIAGS